MKKIRYIALALPFLTMGCHQSTNKNTISLLDYANEAELNDFGLTPERIKEINNTSEDKNWGKGYSHYNNYQKSRVGGFDILTNLSNEDEIYVVKDGKYLLSVDNIEVRLFKDGSSFPNPSNTSVFWNYTKSPSIMVTNSEEAYYDLGLDGPDIFFKKIPYKGKLKYINYSDLIDKLPRMTISGANISGEKCEPLIGEIACCSVNKNIYQAYQFDYNSGWQIYKNDKAHEYCNSGNIEKTSKQLQQELFG